MKRMIVAFTILLAAGWGIAETAGEQTWRETLRTALPLLGHRNWIVVADAAYPWQTSPGIRTVATGAGQLEVVGEVLAALGKTTHVKPVIYLDRELESVDEADAPGIAQYRKGLAEALGGRAVKREPHEEIIKKLDAAGQTFHVLLLKTTYTLPYTSVFLELDCGYWNDAAEKRLRDTMRAKTREP